MPVLEQWLLSWWVAFQVMSISDSLTEDIDSFVKMLEETGTRSFADVLGLICTFRTKVH